MTTLEQRLAALPAARRRSVRRRYRQLALEEMRLDELRRSLGLTQRQMARKLAVRQPRVSKIEAAPGLALDVMRSYVEALGGRLEVVAVFGRRRRVAIKPRADA